MFAVLLASSTSQKDLGCFYRRQQICFQSELRPGHTKCYSKIQSCGRKGSQYARMVSGTAWNTSRLKGVL